MKLIIGIGNPGERYKKNRHNVGWLVLDELKQEISKSEFLISKQIPNPNFKFQKKLQSEVLKIGDVLLAKPQTMMNKSGQAVKKLITHYKLPIPNLWVIHDDLDIKLGEYKIQKGKGPRLHKGVNSIEKELQSEDFWRVRVGVDNRNNEVGIRNYEVRIPGEKYVLQDFTEEELGIISSALDEIAKDLLNRLAS